MTRSRVPLILSSSAAKLSPSCSSVPHLCHLICSHPVTLPFIRPTSISRTDLYSATQESNPFIFVAIDGDGAIFKDEFLKAGADGGAKAAEQLHARIRRHIAATYPESNTQDWSIVVHVILNVDGLSKTLKACGIINSTADLQAFGRAFTRTQPLFSFVDVGFGKEQADHKIRETLRFMIRLSQCKHVLFGPCHDNGYLPVLEEYKRNEAFASRFSLISGTAPGPGFRQLGLAIDKYDEIFRTSNLVPPPSASPPSTISSPRSSTPLPTPVSSVPGSYAKIAPGSLNSMTISIGSKKPKAPERQFYLINAYDERIDTDVPRPDPADEKRFAQKVDDQGRNYCNKDHLMGGCPMDDYCNYEHGGTLKPGLLAVLRVKSRAIKCKNTQYCEDIMCPFSHHCRMGNKCVRSDCRFADTHHVEIVSSVFSPFGTTSGGSMVYAVPDGPQSSANVFIRSAPPIASMKMVVGLL